MDQEFKMGSFISLNLVDWKQIQTRLYDCWLYEWLEKSEPNASEDVTEKWDISM